MHIICYFIYLFLDEKKDAEEAAADEAERLTGKVGDIIADRLLVALGLPRHFNTPNPFDWMELISLQGKVTCARMCLHKTCGMRVPRRAAGVLPVPLLLCSCVYLRRCHVSSPLPTSHNHPRCLV